MLWIRSRHEARSYASREIDHLCRWEPSQAGDRAPAKAVAIVETRTRQMDQLMPLDAPGLNLLPKAPTGIAGFDDITFGVLPAGRPTLICGAAGSGKTLFGATFLVHGAVKFNEPGVFMSFEERAEDLTANVASLGYNLDGLVADGKIAIDY